MPSVSRCCSATSLIKSLSYDMVFINYDVVYKDDDVSCIFYDVV